MRNFKVLAQALKFEWSTNVIRKKLALYTLFIMGKKKQQKLYQLNNKKENPAK